MVGSSEVDVMIMILCYRGVMVMVMFDCIRYNNDTALSTCCQLILLTINYNIR